MLRFGAYALAAATMASLVAMTANVEAGNADQRRVHKITMQSKTFKPRTIRMRDVNSDSRHSIVRRLDNGRKRFNHSTLSFNDRARDRHHANRIRVSTSSVVIITVVGDRGYRMPVNTARNTYSGDVDVYSVPGVGTYSYGDAVFHAGKIDAPAATRTSSVKIIDVNALKANNGCDMQAGVCVIRP